jgi:hypothetical protein
VNGIMCVRGDRGAGGSPRHGRRLPRLPGGHLGESSMFGVGN